jgi:hypothetical protein
MKILKNIVYKTPEIVTISDQISYVVTKEKSGYFIWEHRKTPSFEQVSYKNSFCSKDLLNYEPLLHLEFEHKAINEVLILFSNLVRKNSERELSL